jgi:hypothetical protein
MEHEVKIIMQPGSYYNANVEQQNICLGGTQNIYGRSVHAEDHSKQNDGCKHQETLLPANNDDGDLLDRTFKMFAEICHRSRTYKWGFACQAMKQKGLIISEMTKIDFATMANNHTGVSVETIRHDSEYYEFREKDKPVIDQMVAMINNLQNDNSNM